MKQTDIMTKRHSSRLTNDFKCQRVRQKRADGKRRKKKKRKKDRKKKKEGKKEGKKERKGRKIKGKRKENI